MTDSRAIRALAVAMVFLWASGAEATVIGVTWDGSSTIQSWGFPNTATYGQVITAPSDAFLNDFTFTIEGAGNTFGAYVGTWSGNSVGTVLFSSGPYTTSGSGFNPYTVNTGSLALTPGNQYVLFFSISDYYVANTTSTRWAGYLGSDTTPGTNFVWANNSGNFSDLLSNWNNSGCAADSCGDAAFVANFSSEPVPEPGTLLLIGSGLVGLVARRRRA